MKSLHAYSELNYNLSLSVAAFYSTKNRNVVLTKKRKETGQLKSLAWKNFRVLAKILKLHESSAKLTNYTKYLA